MRSRKLSFEELVDLNKQELLRDEQAMQEIEEQLDVKREQMMQEANRKESFRSYHSLK